MGGFGVIVAAANGEDVEMFSCKLIAIVLFVSSVFGGGISSGCATRSDAVRVGVTENTDDSLADPKVLGEGSISPVKRQFVAIVRDAETYAALKSMATDLPALTSEFFQTNWVVAAFLGERNTAGYSVSISLDPNGQIRVLEKAPRKDAM